MQNCIQIYLNNAHAISLYAIKFIFILHVYTETAFHIHLINVRFINMYLVYMNMCKSSYLAISD